MKWPTSWFPDSIAAPAGRTVLSGPSSSVRQGFRPAFECPSSTRRRRDRLRARVQFPVTGGPVSVSTSTPARCVTFEGWPGAASHVGAARPASTPDWTGDSPLKSSRRDRPEPVWLSLLRAGTRTRLLPRSPRLWAVGRLPRQPRPRLLIPVRHVATWFDATDEERIELVTAVDTARKAIAAAHRPDGYNIGVNVGEAAGQTIFHLHVHVIPRYDGTWTTPAAVSGKSSPARRSIPEDPVAEELREYRVGEVPPDRRRRSPTAPCARVGHWRRRSAPSSSSRSPRRRNWSRCRRRVRLARGLLRIEEHLRDLVRRGGRLRFLTGDYREVTEPDALLRLLDLETAGRRRRRAGGVARLRPPRDDVPSQGLPHPSARRRRCRLRRKLERQRARPGQRHRVELSGRPQP